MVEIQKEKGSEEVQKEQTLQSQIKGQQDKIKDLQNESKTLKKKIDEMKNAQKDLAIKNNQTLATLKQEQSKSKNLAEKLKGSEQ